MSLQRRAATGREFPGLTCAASRHVQSLATDLAAGRMPPSLVEEPEHCAASMRAVVEALWKARAAQKKGKR